MFLQSLQALFQVFPAQAGMIPDYVNNRDNLLCIPRASGDDPNSLDSINYRRYVFPAQAGMIRLLLLFFFFSFGIPRASGDDPTTIEQFQKFL